jgi:capsular polysaccharide biosynthesis protein
VFETLYVEATTRCWVERWNLRGARSAASWTRVGQPERIPRTRPSTVHGRGSWQQQTWDAAQDTSCPDSPPPETFVAEIPDASIFGGDGTVVAPDGAILGDVSIDLSSVVGGSIAAHRLMTTSSVPVPTKNLGEATVLATLGGHNYFHWMFHVLPRLDLVRRVSLHSGRISTSVVNSVATAFQRESLLAIGVDSDEAITLRDSDHLRVTRLTVPSRPSRVSEMSRSSCEYLRRLFLRPDDEAPRRSGSRRLYLARNNAAHRVMTNDAEVRELLEGYGFEEVDLDTMSLRAQAAVVQSAGVVVAPHGAALTNLVFARPGLKVLEIFSPNYINCCYWLLANIMGLDYWFVVGAGDRVRDDVYALTDDIEVEIATLEQSLRGVLAGG